MTVVVEISHEEARGCGFRKPSKNGIGVYLVGPGEGVPCGRLPVPLHACPACGGGIKASRGWNWIEPRKLFTPFWPADTMCGSDELFDWPSPGINPKALRLYCQSCPLGGGIPEGKHGLIWVGEKFYETPADFMAEARRMGVSRKIQQIPKDFELGQTWVYLAHRLTPLGPDDAGEPVLGPAIFTTFKPTGIDLVIADEAAVTEKVEKMADKYGARVVRVVPKPILVPEPQPPESIDVDSVLAMIDAS